ncbi:MAG: hypothetical protein EYC70_07405 [Planctomycetota bacterium]|nr:MAG: hypothetical protein EYC70_07405 [Planctomycetota bacterium]
MTAKELQVQCPCCGAHLRVDARSGKVFASSDKPRAKDLSEVVSRVQERSSKAADSFSAALEAERKRKQELEDLFRKAQDKVKQDGGGESGPDAPLDDRWR